MPDNENPTPQSGETPKSLREVAEAAYDDIVEATPDEGSDEPVDSGGRQRDEYGRFVRAEPGEADAAPPQPSPDDIEAPSTERPTQPLRGEAAGPPENWSEADKEVWRKAPPDMQAWAIRRHTEMEGDYQRKVQTYAAAAQFAQGVAPAFNDPRVASSLQQWGVSPQDAINHWANFHVQAIDPDPQVRAGFILDLAQRIGVPLDPAVLGRNSLSGLPPEAAKDPAIKFFAEYLAKVSNDVQATRARQDRMEHASQQQQEAEALKVTKWGIDAFASQKDAQGNLLHPFFDEVIENIQELYKANPGYDLNTAYEKAAWSHPTVRAKMISHEQQIAAKKAADVRASQAARLNTRGRTVPVTGTNGAGGPKSLRETIEAAAEDLGI